MAVVPFALWRPVPSHSGIMSAHLGLCLHVQVGDGSCYGEFDVPANQASSTWWVSKTGVLEQYVDSDLAAWTEAQGNFTWDSVETEGVPGEPLTDAQVATLARLYEWGHATYGWPYGLSETPSTPGFGWHGMGGAAWGGHFQCPGELRKGQRQEILGLAQHIGHSTPLPPLPAPTPKEIVVPDLNPPWVFQPIVSHCRNTNGLCILLSDDGHIYAPDGGYSTKGPHGEGAPNGQPYFAGRKPAQVKPRSDGGYDVIATTGETYSYPG